MEKIGIRAINMDIQQKFTCSKLMIENLRKDVKYVHQNNVIDFILVSSVLTLDIFHTFADVSIVDFYCFY